MSENDGVEDELDLVGKSLTRIRAYNKTSACLEVMSVLFFLAGAVVAFMLIDDLWPPRVLADPTPIERVQ